MDINDLETIKLKIDTKHNALIVPMRFGDRMIGVPFHLKTIKNCSLNSDKNTTFLRINFHNPGTGNAKEILIPNLKDAKSLFVREMTFKAANGMNL